MGDECTAKSMPCNVLLDYQSLAHHQHVVLGNGLPIYAQYFPIG
jgi:hypothetical protein